MEYPYKRKMSNSNTIPVVHTFTKTLPRMLVLKGYLTLRHETNQSIKMIIGCHRPRDRRLGSACEKCSSVASTCAGTRTTAPAAPLSGTQSHPDQPGTSMAAFCYTFKIRLKLHKRIDKVVHFKFKVPRKSRIFSNGR